MNFFDTKKFTMRREVVKRLLETAPLKRATNVEEQNFLRYLYREGDKGNVELT